MATRRTLNLLELSLSLTYLAVPVFAFTAAKYVRFATSYFSKADVDSSSYVLWIIVVTSIWALVVEKCKLNRAQTIVTFHTGIQAMGKAVFYTMTVAFALFFFYRHALFSRIFVVTGCVLTFLLSLLVLHIFVPCFVPNEVPLRLPCGLRFWASTVTKRVWANTWKRWPWSLSKWLASSP